MGAMLWLPGHRQENITGMARSYPADGDTSARMP